MIKTRAALRTRLVVKSAQEKKGEARSALFVVKNRGRQKLGWGEDWK
jgi:hypothetical protein